MVEVVLWRCLAQGTLMEGMQGKYTFPKALPKYI